MKTKKKTKKKAKRTLSKARKKAKNKSLPHARKSCPWEGCVESSAASATRNGRFSVSQTP